MARPRPYTCGVEGCERDLVLGSCIYALATWTVTARVSSTGADSPIHTGRRVGEAVVLGALLPEHRAPHRSRQVPGAPAPV
jgi:hypothetical protein